MNLSKLAKWEQNLRENELLENDEVIEEHTKGDKWGFLSQTRGNYFFTNKKILFVGGLAGISSFAIPYESIIEMKKCNVGPIPFVPTGIKISYTTSEGNKFSEKCSLPKRNKWFEYLSQKTNK